MDIYYNNVEKRYILLDRDTLEGKIALSIYTKTYKLLNTYIANTFSYCKRFLVGYKCIGSDIELTKYCVYYYESLDVDILKYNMENHKAHRYEFYVDNRKHRKPIYCLDTLSGILCRVTLPNGILTLSNYCPIVDTNVLKTFTLIGMVDALQDAFHLRVISLKSPKELLKESQIEVQP